MSVNNYNTELMMIAFEIKAADILLNLRTMEVHYQGRPVELRRKEFLLLKTFLEDPNRVFTRDELLNSVWGYDAYPVTRTVDNHILQLRKKIAGHLFQTLHGVGYRFRVSLQDTVNPAESAS